MKENFNKFRKGLIYPVKCYCCSKNFNKIHVHHKDGNINNDNTSNFITLCEVCHYLVHHAIIKKRNHKSLFENYDDRVIDRLCELKLILLKRKKIPKNTKDEVFIHKNTSNNIKNDINELIISIEKRNKKYKNDPNVITISYY